MVLEYADYKDGKYYLCECGAAFLYPRKTDEELKQFYTSGDYRNKTSANDKNNKLAIFDVKERANLISEMVRNLEFSTHLDIGCYTGDLIKAIESKCPGIYSLGVDPAPATDDIQIVESIEDVDQEFDLITIIQTLEHVNDPIKFMKQVYDRLAPDKFLIIEVPNRRAWMAAYVPPQHVVAYDVQSLGYLLRDFKIISVNLHGKPGPSPLDLNILITATK